MVSFWKDADTLVIHIYINIEIKTREGTQKKKNCYVMFAPQKGLDKSISIFNLSFNKYEKVFKSHRMWVNFILCISWYYDDDN